MQKISKNKGITLVALVITIIVLLILAGVTIISINGNNGILSKSKLARNKYQNSTEEENSVLSNYENKIDKSTLDIASTRENTKTIVAYQTENTTIVNEISLNYNIYDYDYLLVMGRWGGDKNYASSSQLYRAQSIPIGTRILVNDNAYRTYYTISSQNKLKIYSTDDNSQWYICEIDLIKF